MGIQLEIERPVSTVFRKAQIKRRQNSDGLFESSWTPITEYVKKWGGISAAIDDVKLNKFTHSGANLTCRNDTGKFNDETNSSSLWYGYLTRYRTLVRIQAGYYDTDGSSELPSDPTVGVFVLNDEVEVSGKTNEVVLRLSALKSIFDEVRARDVNFGSLTALASEIVTRIRDHTDGSSRFIFREFITSTAWTIQATTNRYVVNTDTLEDMTVWQLMEKLAEAEAFVVLVNRTGGVEFRNRDARTTTSAFDFAGQGFRNQTVIGIEREAEALDKLYTFFRLKYLEADTSTSYVTAGTTTSVVSTNTSWKYGQRVYEAENTLIKDQSTAQVLVNAELAEFSQVKKEMEFEAKFVPQMEVLDRITMSYRSYDLSFHSLWDVMVWDADRWSVEGQNFDYHTKPYKVISRNMNLDNFSMKIRAREV